MNKIYYGTELCSNCNQEFNFEYNPVKHYSITCNHCGTVQQPCSLCNNDIVNCNDNCHNNILKSLKGE